MRITESEEGRVLEINTVGGIANRLKGLPSLIGAVVVLYLESEGFKHFEWSSDLVWLLLWGAVGAVSLLYVISLREHITVDLDARTVVHSWRLAFFSKKSAFSLDDCRVFIVKESDKNAFHLHLHLFRTTFLLAPGTTLRQARTAAQKIARVHGIDPGKIRFDDTKVEFGWLPEIVYEEDASAVLKDIKLDIVRIKPERRVIEIPVPKGYAAVRQSAEELAMRLGVDIQDGSTEHMAIRKAEDIKIPLRDRLRRDKGAPELPDAPEDLETQFKTQSGSIVLRFPYMGWVRSDIHALIGAFVILVIGCMGAALFPMPRLLRDEGFGLILWIFVGLIGLITLAMLVGAVVKAIARVTVTVSPQQLMWRRRILFFRRRKTIASDELEELVLPRVPPELQNQRKGRFLGLPIRPPKETSGILARSDKASFEFGHNLSMAELTWIHSVIVKILVV